MSIFFFPRVSQSLHSSMPLVFLIRSSRDLIVCRSCREHDLASLEIRKGWDRLRSSVKFGSTTITCAYIEKYRSIDYHRVDVFIDEGSRCKGGTRIDDMLPSSSILCRSSTRLQLIIRDIFTASTRENKGLRPISFLFNFSCLVVFFFKQKTF